MKDLFILNHTRIWYNKVMFEKLSKNSNVFLSSSINAIAIYDHKLYDRSDLDILSSAQRSFIINKLATFGFKQISGNKLKGDNFNIIFPKNAHIASSPLDLIKYTKLDEGDYLILTPTQLFMVLFDNLMDNEAIYLELKELIQKLPVNLVKIKDIAKQEKFYSLFLSRYNELSNLQEKAVAESLKNKHHLGKI